MQQLERRKQEQEAEQQTIEAYYQARLEEMQAQYDKLLSEIDDAKRVAQEQVRPPISPLLRASGPLSPTPPFVPPPGIPRVSRRRADRARRADRTAGDGRGRRIAARGRRRLAGQRARGQGAAFTYQEAVSEGGRWWRRACALRQVRPLRCTVWVSCVLC